MLYAALGILVLEGAIGLLRAANRAAWPDRLAHLPPYLEFLALTSVGEYHTKTLPEFAGSTVRTPYGPFTLVGKTPAPLLPDLSSRP